MRLPEHTTLAARAFVLAACGLAVAARWAPCPARAGTPPHARSQSQ